MDKIIAPLGVDFDEKSKKATIDSVIVEDGQCQWSIDTRKRTYLGVERSSDGTIDCSNKLCLQEQSEEEKDEFAQEIYRQIRSAQRKRIIGEVLYWAKPIAALVGLGLLVYYKTR